ncbi:hypothetical protein GK091_25130 [Spirosoma agri]|uniref:Uncharacterized protein n=1 Tax=Spirosoma agri TaxID=1987381 RepID=A0A6M0IRR4_9BACT|nr:hypothetical protein [Spirosoma agri]NEU70185.1 hypothetical protein [Spirosoma agri]
MTYFMRRKLLWLRILGGSLTTAWLGYTLVMTCFQDWGGLTSDLLSGGRFWSKSLVLYSWLVAAIYFLRDRPNLIRDK